jgi:hypothetical protein
MEPPSLRGVRLARPLRALRHGYVHSKQCEDRARRAARGLRTPAASMSFFCQLGSFRKSGSEASASSQTCIIALALYRRQAGCRLSTFPTVCQLM